MNPTEWAKAQDAVIRGESPVLSLVPFEPLCVAQKALGGTNLTIRQDCLLGRLKEAEKTFYRLVKNGFWTEGPSYLEYTSQATGKAGILGEAVEAIWGEYSRFQAPDGSLPFPEASEALRAPFPPPKEEVTESPGLYCKRWYEDGKVVRFLLVFLDPKPGNPKNLHVWPSFGHYVLWYRGVWLKAPHWYTGWGNRDVKREYKYLNAPRGPWNSLGWRFAQSPLKVLEKTPETIRIQYGRKFWLFGRKVTRTFTLTLDGVEVEDEE